MCPAVYVWGTALWRRVALRLRRLEENSAFVFMGSGVQEQWPKTLEDAGSTFLRNSGNCLPNWQSLFGEWDCLLHRCDSNVVVSCLATCCLLINYWFAILYLSIYISVFLSIYLSVCISVYLSSYLPLSLSLSVYLSVYLSIYLSVCLSVYLYICRSRWPRGLSYGSAAACLVGLRVRIPPGAWMSVLCECCFLSGRGLCDGPTHILTKNVFVKT